MVRRSHALRVLACLLLLGVEASSLAQEAPPPQLGIAITSASELSPEQRELVAAWAEYWSDQLTSPDSSPDEVERSRRELMRPLGAVGRPSPAFRFEYSTVVVPAIEPLLTANGRPHASLNAAIVLGELASRRALDALVDNADSNRQQSREIRIQAAMNVAKALIRYGDDRNILKIRDLQALVRDLRQAASREDDPIVLRHQLTAILTVELPEARDALVEALRDVVEKITGHTGDVSPLVVPFYYTVHSLRNSYIDFPTGEKTRIGTELGPIVREYLNHLVERWEQLHNGPELIARHAGPIRVSESLLKLIVVNTANTPAPATSLRQHWESDDQEAFRNEVSQWNEVLRQPPFGR